MTSRRSDRDAETLSDDVSTSTGWGRARQRLDPLSAKVPARRITINIDADVLAIFKAEALRGGPPYQVAINQALRQYLHDRERDANEEAVKVVLRALEDESVREAIRRIG